MWVMFVCAVMTGSVAWGETASDARLRQVEQRLLERWAGIRTIEADWSMDAESELVQGMTMETEGWGTFELAKRGKDELIRIEQRAWVLYHTLDGAELESEGDQLHIFDGTHWHHSIEMGGHQRTQRSSVGPEDLLDRVGGPALFEALHRYCTVELLDAESIGRMNCYVIEAKSDAEKIRKEKTRDLGHHLYYFDERTGIAVKHIVLDEEGYVVKTVELSDLEINGRVDLGRFEFKPLSPAGAVQASAWHNPHTIPTAHATGRVRFPARQAAGGDDVVSDPTGTEPRRVIRSFGGHSLGNARPESQRARQARDRQATGNAQPGGSRGSSGGARVGSGGGASGVGNTGGASGVGNTGSASGVGNSGGASGVGNTRGSSGASGTGNTGSSRGVRNTGGSSGVGNTSGSRGATGTGNQPNSGR
jgi:hypothetical protein